MRLRLDHMVLEKMTLGMDRTLKQIWRGLPKSVSEFTKSLLKKRKVKANGQ